MSRKAIFPIPKGIVAARTALNGLASEGTISLISKNSLWTEAEISCSPLKCETYFSRENIELVLKIRIGNIFDTLGIDEVMEELPIPVSYIYSLEPEPELFIIGNLPLLPQTDKSEVMNFVKNSFVMSLMAAQVCLVTDSLTQKSRNFLLDNGLPSPNSIWDFGSLTEKLLSKNG